MNIDEVIQQPGTKERMLKEDILKSLHVAIPGEIEAYYPDRRVAIIQPVIRDWGCKDPPPLLLDVPVFFWGNFTFTPQKGDGCLVVCADSCIDSWLQSGGVSSPVVARTHSLSDGFAFVGFRQTGGTDLPTVLGNKKDKQESVADPTASGESIEFISGITQDANGVISPQKKSVRSVGKGVSGLCPALPNEESTSKYLRQDGTWSTPPGSTYDVVSKNANGLCPKLPNESTTTKYLRQDGTWVEPPDTVYNVVDKTANGLCPQLPNESSTDKYLRQDGTWVAPPDTTYGVVDKTANGLCPQLPDESTTTKYLRQDGTWVVPPDTTYGVVSKNGNGLCPQLPNESTTEKYLRQDGTWVKPPNTNTWRGYQVKFYSHSWSSLEANSTLEITGNQFKDSNNAVMTSPSGYTPVAVLKAFTGHSQVQLVGFRGEAAGANWVMRARNTSSSTKSGIAEIAILYLKTGSP